MFIWILSWLGFAALCIGVAVASEKLMEDKETDETIEYKD